MKRFSRAMARGAVAVLIAGAALPASAGPITKNLGGGWQVTIFDSRAVDVQTLAVDVDRNFLDIRKTAEFTAFDDITGQPAAINLAFQQIAPDRNTVTRIRLDEELLTNSLGQAWIAFRNELLGSAATFDPDRSNDFSIAPFTVSTFGADNGSVTFDGGLVPDGATWSPGAASGKLVIKVDLSSPTPVAFSLKELPFVPEPSTCALLTLGAVLAGRRRR